MGPELWDNESSGDNEHSTTSLLVSCSPLTFILYLFPAYTTRRPLCLGLLCMMLPHQTHPLMPAEHMASNSGLYFSASVASAGSCVVWFSVTYAFLVPTMCPRQKQICYRSLLPSAPSSHCQGTSHTFINPAVRLLPSHLA